MRFAKMHGLGNDFMIVDAITQNVSFSSNVIRDLSDRHCGVGFDQLLIVESSAEVDIDFYYRIFNSNGEEVFQCGNGVRCLGKFLHMKKLTNKSTICVTTKTRRMILFIFDDEVRVNMGEPIFDPKQVPFCFFRQANDSYFISVGDHEIACWVVSIGNPHCVLIIQDVQDANVSVLGPMLENHFCFPEKVNVSFMEIVDRKHIRLRVYERGVGETKSCGSAACAAVSVGVLQGVLSDCVLVELLGGSLIINWRGVGHSLYMDGATTHVYDGCIYL